MGAKPGKHIGRSASNHSGFHSNTSTDNDDELDNPGGASKWKKSSRKSKKMPFFRKQSDTARKRLDQQQYLAEASPEPVYDISNCEVEEVPSDVFPQCRVLLKEVLLLHDNWIGHLPGGGVADLTNIRVLDLHNNELKSLPCEIGQLNKLQVLNLENNRLSGLPDTVGNLNCLQTLNVKDNNLKSLPPTICSLQSLRMLDISENHVTVLPKQLCNIRTLETLAIDAQSMVYPSNDVCCSGTESVMKFLCSECSIEYLPPSNFLLNVLDPPKSSVSTSPTSKSYKDEENLMRSITGYNDLMEKKRIERIEVERQFAEHQEEQAQLAVMAQTNHQQLLKVIAAEETQLECQLGKLAHEKEVNRIQLVQDLQIVEQGADVLIAKLLDINDKARKTEDLLDEIEQERIIKDKLFEVRWEETQNLRKKEIFGAMERALQHSEWFEKTRQNFSDEKENSLQRELEHEEEMTNAQVESVLEHNDKQFTKLLDDLAKMDELQKEAFKTLQLQKDIKHRRITAQINLIQDELASLTVVEMEKRDYRMEEEMNRLAEKRITLIELLSQLMFEQDCRKSELMKRLAEMEQQRQDGQDDYWLCQYQRLMDQKPQSLIDQEHRLEISVVKIINKSNAEDYMPVFARHRISIETLLQMSDQDLKQMGIHEMGIRKAILQHIEAFKSDEATCKPTVSKIAAPVPQASAPPIEDISPSRQISVTARGLNSECSICLDNMSDVIFMNCGHVCCCAQCSDSVQQCPLCRQEIVRRIRLQHSPML